MKKVFDKPPLLEEDSNEANSSSISFLNDEDRFVDLGLYTEGGMKSLYEIEDTFTGKSFIKAVIKPDYEDKKAVENFLNEARITSLLDHPNIPPVMEISEDKGAPCFKMRLIKGSDLSDIIKNKGHITLEDLSLQLEIFLKACDAVSFAHSKNIVHLDLKPCNIIIGEYGEVYVCDWGLAVEMDSMPERFSVRGTPGFIAPELLDKINDTIDCRADIFSLGVILYCMLYGKAPFSGSDTKSLLGANIAAAEIVELDSTIPGGLNKIILKALAFDKDERYENVSNFSGDIRNFLSRKMLSMEKGLTTRFIKLVKRNPKVAGVSALSSAAIIIGLIVSSSIIKDISYGRKLAELQSQRLQGANKELMHNASIEFYNKAIHLDNLHKFHECKHYIQMSMQFNDNRPEAWFLKGRMFLGELQFKEAAMAFNKADTLPAKDYLSALERKKEPLQFVKAILNLTGGRRTVNHLMRNGKEYFKGMNYTDLFKALNSDFVNENFIYNKENKSLKLTGSVKNVSPALLLDLDNLDLSNTKFSNTMQLRNSGIRNINLSWTDITTLWPLQNNEKLKYLKLKKCKLDTIAALKNLELKQLDITGANISETDSLNSFKSLEKVWLSKDQINENIVEQLRNRGVKIRISGQ